MTKTIPLTNEDFLLLGDMEHKIQNCRRLMQQAFLNRERLLNLIGRSYGFDPEKELKFDPREKTLTGEFPPKDEDNGREHDDDQSRSDQDRAG